jgi:hypothetical protein
MDIDDTQLKQYWSKISASIDRLIGATAFMREWAQEIPAPDSSDTDRTLKTIIDSLAGNSAGMLMPHALGWPLQKADNARLPDSDPQLVTPVDNKFLGGMRLLIKDLKARIEAFPASRDKEAILSLLSDENPHSLAARFGSFTAAWDLLVILKYETSIPNRRQRKFDAWFTTLVGVSERFIRDIVGFTVLLAGRNLASDALRVCFQSGELGVPNPDPNQLVQLPTTDAVLTETVMNFMDRGSRQTTLFADQFAKGLGTSLFPPDEAGFVPGILSELPMFEAGIESAWIEILSLRKAIVHETTKELRGSRLDRPHEWLYDLDEAARELVADFLCAFSFGFATRILVAVADRAFAEGGSKQQRRDLLDQLRRQLSGELRVLVMRLLLAQRYGLAWAIAEAAIQAEPSDSSPTMLRLDAYFARLRFGRGYVEWSEIESFEVSPLPRHQLLKRVLLGDLEQSHLEPLLDAAVASRDLSLAELSRWPALEDLRKTSWWLVWEQRHR